MKDTKNPTPASRLFLSCRECGDKVDMDDVRFYVFITEHSIICHSCWNQEI